MGKDGGGGGFTEPSVKRVVTTKEPSAFVEATSNIIKETIGNFDDVKWKSPPEVTVSSGGALRYNKGKPQFSHLSPDFILEMASLMTKSAEKYSRQNWLKKQDIRTASDSLFRHYVAFMSGQDNDEGGSEMSHLLHIAVNAMIMWENYRQYGEEVDNRFYKTIKELMSED